MLTYLDDKLSKLYRFQVRQAILVPLPHVPVSTATAYQYPNQMC